MTLWQGDPSQHVSLKGAVYRDNRVPKLELASQHCTKQLQVTFVPLSSRLQGIRELKLLSFLSICNTCLRMTLKLEEG